MSVLITGKLVSPTGTELDHDPSHVRLLTQAPKDNGGDGLSTLRGTVASIGLPRTGSRPQNT
jgi:hypothetical protein